MTELATTVNLLSAESSILKRDDDQRLVYGWASVITKDGVPVIDGQGDIIEEDTLVAAVHQFNTDARVGGVLHMRKSDGTAVQIGSVIESFVFTKSIQDLLGIDLKKTGWFLVMKVLDDRVWSLVKQGALPAFSIGGKGVRVPVAASQSES